MIPLHDDNPTQIVPFITIAFIVICVLVFFWQLSLGQGNQTSLYTFGLIPAVLFEAKQLPSELTLVPAWTTMFTSMFFTWRLDALNWQYALLVDLW